MYRGINLQGNTASSRVPLSHFANFSPNLSYYFPQMGRPTLRYLPFDRNYFRTPDVKSKFKSTYVADKTLDYTEKELLDESETMRGPRERDFYQDHSYFDQWIERDLNKDQSEQLMKVYGWMVPGYEVKPWIWHPGDTVEVVKGPFAGQRGTILNIVKYKNECFVQNVNVQPIVVPASESRPEQTILREHPIDVRLVKLVDPQSNEPCDVKLVTVRDKETGQKIERRMSLATGVLLPLPKPSNNDSVETGDPMYDTPLEDAEEPTYFPDQELPVMTARKLRAMEDHFVEALKEAHVHHEKYREDNVKHLRLYQQQVVKSSARYVLSTVFRGKLRLSASQRAMWAEATADIELPRKQTDAGDDEPVAAADNADEEDEEEAASVEAK